MREPNNMADVTSRFTSVSESEILRDVVTGNTKEAMEFGQVFKGYLPPFEGLSNSFSNSFIDFYSWEFFSSSDMR